jgi:hypothetical protein
MSLTCRYFLAAACGTSLSLAACGSDNKSTPDIDSGPVTSTHHDYVVSEALVPTTTNEVDQYALDVGTRTSNVPGAPTENALGFALFSLSSVAKFPIQDTITDAVNRGSILLLADVETSDFTNAASASFTVKLGANPQPPACSSDTDTTCGNHLKGTGTFTIAQDSPTASTLTGSIANGTLNAGPGNLTLQIALGSTDPIPLSLVNARVKATSITETGMTALIGGAVLAETLQTSVLPAIHLQLGPLLERDCGPEAARTPPSCGGCPKTGLSTGSLIMNQFDSDPADCKVTIDEVKNAGLTQFLLAPDVCSTASCAKADALSIGIKVTAVKASF